MNIIESLKNIFSSQNNKDNKIKALFKDEQEVKRHSKMILNNFYIRFHKYIFKCNYKKKKEKGENTSNNLKNNDNKNISELISEKNGKEKFFFYILKGAIYIIEDWWKKTLIKKETNKRILQRNFNNKNFKIFCTTNYKNEFYNFENVLRTEPNINNINNNINLKKYIYHNNNVFSRNDNGQNIKLIKTVNLSKNESYQEQNTLEETLINSDSCFFDFTSFNKNNTDNINDYSQKMNKNIITKENNKTKRENSIIYPIKEINLMIKKDMNKFKEKKNKKIFFNKNGNKISLKKDAEQDNITISWEEQNNKITPNNSIEQEYELFREIKSKIKADKEMLSVMNNKYLLKENPFDESSIYINNSYLKQDELIRNVNVHIIPPEIKNISLKKYCNNSNNSNTIQNDDDEPGSSFLGNIYKNEEKDKKKE